jgi:hypothetical protein
MKFKTGDIVRVKHEIDLFEVVDVIDAHTKPEGFDYDYTVTNDECDTEIYVIEKDLIPVCYTENRLDLKE